MAYVGFRYGQQLFIYCSLLIVIFQGVLGVVSLSSICVSKRWSSETANKSKVRVGQIL